MPQACYPRQAKDVSVRLLTLLTRLRVAAWLGIAGIGVQAALPLLLAAAMVSVAHEAAANGAVSAIHPHMHHAGHAPGAPYHPAHHPGHAHADCVLCQGLQASGSLTLPSSLSLPLPAVREGGYELAPPAAPCLGGSLAAYASRAPPSTV
jgi:hypothetical protein